MTGFMSAGRLVTLAAGGCYQIRNWRKQKTTGKNRAVFIFRYECNCRGATLIKEEAEPRCVCFFLFESMPFVVKLSGTVNPARSPGDDQ